MAWTTTRTVTEKVKDTNPNTYIKRAEMQLKNCNYTQAIREIDEAIGLTKGNEKNGVKDQKLKIIEQFFRMAVNSINYSKVLDAIEETRFCIENKQHIFNMNSYKSGIENIIIAFFNNKQIPKNTNFDLVVETIDSCIKLSGNSSKYTTKFNEYKSLAIISDIESINNRFDINNLNNINVQINDILGRINDLKVHHIVKKSIDDLLGKIVKQNNYSYNSRFKIKELLNITNMLIPFSGNIGMYGINLSSYINSFIKEILARVNSEDEVLEYLDLVIKNGNYVKVQEDELLLEIYTKFRNYEKLLKHLDSNFDNLLLSNEGKLKINQYRDIIYSRESNVVHKANSFFERKAIPKNLIKINFVNEFNFNFIKNRFYKTIDDNNWSYANELYSCVKRYFSYINLDESYLNKYWVHNKVYGDGKNYYNHYINQSNDNYYLIRRMTEFMIKFNEKQEAIQFVELLLGKLYNSKELSHILKLFTIYEDVHKQIKPNTSFTISKSYIKFGNFIIKYAYPNYKIHNIMNENKLAEIIEAVMEKSNYSDIKDGIMALKHYYRDTKVRFIIDEFRCKVEDDIEQLNFGKIKEGIEVICSSLNVKEDAEIKKYLIKYLENNISKLDINDIGQLIVILKSKFSMAQMNYVTFANKAYAAGQPQKAIDILKKAAISSDRSTAIEAAKIKLKAYKDLKNVEQALNIYEDFFISYLNSYDDEELLKEFYKYAVKNKKAKEGKVILNKYLNKYYSLPNPKKKLINNYLAKLDLRTLSIGKYVMHKYKTTFLKDVENFIRAKIKIIASIILIISLIAGVIYGRAYIHKMYAEGTWKPNKITADINLEELSLLVGTETEYKLKVEVSPKYAKAPNVEIVSSNPDIVTVAENKLVAKSEGSSEIQVNVNGETTKIYKVDVYKSFIKEFTVDYSSDLEEVGDEMKLDVNIVYVDSISKNYDVEIVSSNEKVLTVKNNYIKAVGSGTADIFVRVNGEEKRLIFEIKPKKKSINSLTFKNRYEIGEEIYIDPQFYPVLTFYKKNNYGSYVKVDNVNRTFENGYLKILEPGKAELLISDRTNSNSYKTVTFTVGNDTSLNSNSNNNYNNNSNNNYNNNSSNNNNYNNSRINEPSYGDSSYIFKDINRTYLTNDELRNLSKDTLAFMRNEIFARHGYIFKDDPFKKYFESKSWYRGTKDSVSESELNNYEIENIKLIKQFE